MRKRKIIVLMLVSCSVMASQGASPSLNSKCQYNIVTPPNGSGVILNEGCNTAFVLPPINGNAEIKHLARSTNLQFCSSIKNVHQITDKTFSSMKIIVDKIEAMINDFAPLDQELFSLRLKLSESKMNKEAAKQRLEFSENKLNMLNEGIIKAKQEYKNCVNENSLDDPICLEFKLAWDQAKQQAREFRATEYAQNNEKYEEAESEFNLLSGRFSIYYNRYSDAITPMVELQARLSELSLKTMELYQEYTKLDGATGQIVWTIPWDHLLDDYRRVNPHIHINWHRIPIKEAEFVSTINNRELMSELGTIPAVKSAVIPGTKATGFLGMPNGQKVNGPQLSPTETSCSSFTFGNSVSGQITFTLAGACSYFDGINERPNISFNELSALTVSNLIFTYEVGVRRSYIASYNLSNLLKKMENKAKRGGFFSTSHVHSLIDNADSTDWFSIRFDANSAEFQYSVAEQEEIKKSVKQELTDKAIKQFAILNAGISNPPLLPDYLNSGAATASEGLRKCMHHYCQAGSLVLGVADSIWGKSDAVQNFHENNRSWATQKVEGQHFIDFSGTLTFIAGDQ